MSTEKAYGETRPAACATDVTCRECGEDVVMITFAPDRSDFGVCACPWTSWCRQPDGKFFRSTPLGYEPKKHFRPKASR